MLGCTGCFKGSCSGAFDLEALWCAAGMQIIYHDGLSALVQHQGMRLALVYSGACKAATLMH
jgi:hypothetical protein